MSTTSGSFAAILQPDLTKEAVGYTVGVAAGAGAAQVVNPAVPVQSVTIYNYTTNLMRATVTFTEGITSTGTRTVLVPPSATATVDFANNDGDNAVGAIDGIDSVSLIAVTPAAGAVTEASMIPEATAAVAGFVYLNFAAS